jgi:hypothetical protein
MSSNLELEFLVLILGSWQFTDVNALDGLHHIHIDPSLLPVVYDFKLPLIRFLSGAEGVYDGEELCKEFVQAPLIKRLNPRFRFIDSHITRLHI